MAEKPIAIDKVLMLAPRMEPRGTSEYTLHLARELVASGVEVVVFCEPGPMLPALERSGVSVTAFDGLESFRFYFGRRRRFLAAVEEFEPQLVHAHSMRVAKALELVRRSTGLPAVLTAHWRPSGVRMFRRLARRLAGIIATTQDARQQMVNQCGVDAKMVSFIPNGIDVASMEARPLPPIFRSAVPVVGSLGPIEEQRGHDLFVQAVSRLVRSGVEAQFVIAGEGDQLPVIRRLIGSLGLERYVTLATDFAAYEEVLGALDIVVLSSLVDVSGFSILAAMGYGRPVVAFNMGTACEMVEDGRTGLLVPKGDVTALGDAIARLLKGSEMARELGRNAVRRVRDKFDIRVIARRTLQLYADILSERQGGGK